MLTIELNTFSINIFFKTEIKKSGSDQLANQSLALICLVNIICKLLANYHLSDVGKVSD